MQTSVEIEIANGIYPCAIGLQGVREIERAGKGDGIGLIIARTMAGRLLVPSDDTGSPTQTYSDMMSAAYRVDEIIEWVRQGLIGGAALGLKPVIDGVPAANACTQSRANEVLQNYLLPPVGNLDQLWSLAAFIALNLAEGYVPIEKKSQSPVTETPKPKPRHRKTDTSSVSPTA